MRIVPPKAERNQVTYQRGTLNEWYVNGPLGLQQGFTLTQPPTDSERRAAEDRGWLTVALEMGGGLQAKVDDDRRGLVLTSADGTARLRYRGLAAYDATERALPA
ncbi:MAG: hypothetical protein ACRDIB_08375, partial [Ardenticatenaceae bacterium]